MNNIGKDDYYTQTKISKTSGGRIVYAVHASPEIMIAYIIN